MEIASITHRDDALAVAFKDGTAARIVEPKTSLLKQHIVALIGGWEDKVAATYIDPDSLAFIELPGCVVHFLLAYVTAEMIAGRLPEGAVDLDRIKAAADADPFFASRI